MINLLNPYTCIAFCFIQIVLLILAIDTGGNYMGICSKIILLLIAVLLITIVFRLVEILSQVSWI